MPSIRRNKKHWDKYIYSKKFVPFPRKEVIRYGYYLGASWINYGNFMGTSW